MRKILLVGLAGLALAAAPSASFARDHGGWGGGYGGYHERGDGDDVALGVGGLALGTALGFALSGPHYAPPPRYYGYAPQPYYEDEEVGPPPGYYRQGECVRRELRWDPRLRENVEIVRSFPC